MKVIYAHGIHTGGGLTLLKMILTELENKIGYKIILDSRVKGKISDDKLSDVKYFRSGFFGRILSEFYIFVLGAGVSRILSFNSLPFLLPINKKVTLFFQNINLVNIGHNYTFISLIKSMFFRLNASRVDRYIVQSSSVQNLLGSITDRPSIILTLLEKELIYDVFPSCVSEVKFESAKKFIYVADDSKHKNHTVLFEAWKLLKEYYPGAEMDLYLTFLGSAEHPYGRFTGQYEFSVLRIHNLGYLSKIELMKWYRNCDALVFPSLSESLGLPLLEAQRYGVDIIASELDYVRDICCPIESFDPSSSRSLARAIARYCGLDLPLAVIPTDTGSFLEAVFELKE